MVDMAATKMTLMAMAMATVTVTVWYSVVK